MSRALARVRPRMHHLRRRRARRNPTSNDVATAVEVLLASAAVGAVADGVFHPKTLGPSSMEGASIGFAVATVGGLVVALGSKRLRSPALMTSAIGFGASLATWAVRSLVGGAGTA
jgi:hypothetical protein